MRILYVNNLNRVPEILGENLVRRGHNVTVCQPSLKGASAAPLLKLAMMPGRVLDMAPLARKLNAHYTDIVHIHWASYGALGLVSQVPFIVHCCGSDVRYRLKQPLFHSALKHILRRAAAVLCSTPDLLSVIQPVCPDVMFFPRPVDTTQFAPDKNERSHPWTILLFARLDPIKGSEGAVQGIAQFAERHPEIHVKLVDWGSEARKYKQHYGKRFEFVSLVPQKAVQHLICSADVVVGQIFLGALGLAELQAMSCAKPVIASFRYEEAYSSPPPLYQAATAQEVDERLEYCFLHPEAAKELGEHARKWIITYHDLQILVVKLEKFYQSILGTPGEHSLQTTNSPTHVTKTGQR